MSSNVWNPAWTSSCQSPSEDLRSNTSLRPIVLPSKRRTKAIERHPKTRRTQRPRHRRRQQAVKQKHLFPEKLVPANIMIHRGYRREPPEFALFSLLYMDGSIPYDLVMHGARISLPILFNSGTLYISMARGRIWKFESASEVAEALFARRLEKDTQ